MALAGLLSALVIGSVQAIGTVHATTLVLVALTAGGAMVLAWLSGRSVAVPAAPLAWGLAAYTLVQAVPMPLELLARLSPQSAAVWEAALAPWETTASAGSVSIDPPASLVEALKWWTYGTVFALAAIVGKRRGAPFVAELLFSSALALALVTLAHGLLDAEQVFGLYEPSFRPTRWATSPLLNPNNLSGYLNLGTFAGLALLVTSRPTWPRWLVAPGCALLVAQTVLAASRGGVLCLLLGLVLFAVLVPRIGQGKTPSRSGRRSFWTWPVVSALLGGLVLALLGAQRSTWEDLWQEGREKLSIAEWTQPLVADHAWFGVGGGAFETAFPPYRVLGGPLWAHPENFVVAWICEWGVPVGVGALGALLWIFRPRQLDAHRSRLAATLTLGVCVLCLQNLVDLAFSLPGVFLGLATALGGLWGARDADKPLPSAVSGRGPDWASLRARLLPVAGLVLGAVAWLAVVGVGWSRASDARSALTKLYRSTRFQEAEARDAFFSALQAATLRHPGDPYLPSLGALAAMRTPGKNPLRFASQALERDPMSGRVHLLLAEILAQRGQRGQALLHLRLGAERDQALASVLARRAVAWAGPGDDLWRSVPEEAAGAPMLTSLARQLDAAHAVEAPLRRRLLETALQRDPEHDEARQLLARDLLGDIEAERFSCAAPATACFEAVEAQVAALRTRDPSGQSDVELRGLLLARRDRRPEAVALLLAECGRTNAACLRLAVQLSAQTPDLPLDAPTQAYVAVACRTAASCTSARLWVGDLYARRSLWGPALTHYAHAAESSRDPKLWLRVADAASRQGAHRRALDALRRAESLLDAKDGDLAQRAQNQRKEVVARMAQAPSRP